MSRGLTVFATRPAVGVEPGDVAGESPPVCSKHGRAYDAGRARYTAERTFKLRSSGRVVDLVNIAGEAPDDPPMALLEPVAPLPEMATRGEIVEFSWKSRGRLLKRCAALPVDLVGWLFVTLTLPAEWDHNGRRQAANLHAFRNWWERTYGTPRAVWKREYQRRGAPHWHLAIIAPEGVPLCEVRRAASAAWYSIVGSGDERHLRAGVQVDELRGPPSVYFGGYAGHEKLYQEMVPASEEAPGRFWGTWGLAAEWVEVELTWHQYLAVRRALWGVLRARGGRVNAYGLGGCWVAVRGSALREVARLAAWAGAGPPGVAPA